MITTDQALSTIPDGLRNPLIQEYSDIQRNYLEHKWTPGELSGGRFCEVVYTILQGYATGTYAPSPTKPPRFVDACRALETTVSGPRSFRILIPRILPALYEIRNNRGVGHVGGDVDSNHIDALAVLSISSWIMAELIRVFHDVDIRDAQKIADSLADRSSPLVWQSGDIRRVLQQGLTIKQQVLLVSSPSAAVTKEELLRWLEPSDRPYFMKVLRQMHRSRLIDLSSDEATVTVLPPGMAIVEAIISTQVP